MNIPQYTSDDADTIVSETNDYYTNELGIVTLTCVKGRVSAYYTLIIPTDRAAEFEAADATKQSNFITITLAAQAPVYSGTDFETAWETEYAKIYP